MLWLATAILSAVFAGVASVLAKCGIKKTDSDIATALRNRFGFVCGVDIDSCKNRHQRHRFESRYSDSHNRCAGDDLDRRADEKQTISTEKPR